MFAKHSAKQKHRQASLYTPAMHLLNLENNPIRHEEELLFLCTALDVITMKQHIAFRVISTKENKVILRTKLH